MSLHKYTVQEAQNAALGQAGSVLIDDDSTHTGPFTAITALTNCTVDVSDCTFGSLMVDYAADFVIPAGVTIYGTFTVFSIESGGKCIAYKG